MKQWTLQVQQKQQYTLARLGTSWYIKLVALLLLAVDLVGPLFVFFY